MSLVDELRLSRLPLVPFVVRWLELSKDEMAAAVVNDEYSADIVFDSHSCATNRESCEC